MTEVVLEAGSGIVGVQASLARLQKWYQPVAGHGQGRIPLRLVEMECERPFRVGLASGVIITTWQAAGISGYVGVTLPDYLAVCALLGLLQWQVLRCHSMLQPHDLTHTRPDTCPYARHVQIEEYALVFDEGEICPGCLHFYARICHPRAIDAVTGAYQRVFGRRSRWRTACESVARSGVPGGGAGLAYPGLCV